MLVALPITKARRKVPSDVRRERLRRRLIGRWEEIETPLARRIRETWRDMRAGSVRARIERAVELEDAQGIAEELGASGPAMERLRKDLHAAFVDAYTVGAEGLAGQIDLWLKGGFAKREGEGPEIGFRFDMVSSEAVTAARTQAGALIQGITERQLSLIRAILASGFENGRTVRQIARDIQDIGVSLTNQQWRQVFKFERRLAATERFKYAQILARRERFIRKLERTRALTIARTEVIRAGNRGQLAALDQAVREGRITEETEKEWVATLDQRTDLDCQQLDGERVPMRENFSLGVDAPPIHTDCRCSLSVHPVAPQRRL